jgi:hypothetical protein
MTKAKKKAKKPAVTEGEKVFARDAEMDADAAKTSPPVDLPHGGTGSEIVGAPAGSPEDMNPKLPNPAPLEDLMPFEPTSLPTPVPSTTPATPETAQEVSDTDNLKLGGK